MIQLNWETVGTIENSYPKDNDYGIYIFVYKTGQIIYVGETTNTFQWRFGEHKILFLHGGRTIRILADGQDIYDLFRLQDNEDVEKRLEENFQMWLPGCQDGIYFKSKFNSSFNSEWKEVAQNYIKDIAIYINKPLFISLF